MTTTSCTEELGACRTTIMEYEFVDGPNASKIKDQSYREGMYECVIQAICKQEGKSYAPVTKDAPVTKAKPIEKSDKIYRVQSGGF